MSRAAARPAGTLTLPVLLLAAITALGCGIQPWSPPGPADLDDVPLDVWLPSGPDIAATPYTVFHVNKPAYVAIFDIHPGEGVRAIHPRGPRSGQRLVSAGYGMTSLLGQSSATCHPLGVSPVVYRFIVASTEPLDIEALRGDVSFRHVPGIRTGFFATGSPVRTMESVVERVLPQAPRALDTADWAAYYTPYWVPPCEPRVRTRLARTLTPPDPGETKEMTGDGEGENTREIPEITPPRQPVDVRVAPAPTGEDALVTAGRLGEAEGVSERLRIPERIDAYERIRHRIPVPASSGAARAVPRSDRAGRDSRPRVERPDRVRMQRPRVQRPKRVRSGASERPKKPSKPKKDGDGER